MSPFLSSEESGSGGGGPVRATVYSRCNRASPSDHMLHKHKGSDADRSNDGRTAGSSIVITCEGPPPGGEFDDEHERVLA